MAETLLTRLARFACDLQMDDLPAAVVERVRLQHLSAAGALLQVSDTPFAKTVAASTGRRGAAIKATGGSASRRDATRLHSALLSAWGWDDHLFMGPVSAGGTTAAWALAKGRTLTDLITATAAANEVAGRLSAALLIGSGPADAHGEVHALAAATAAGVLEGLDALTLAHAMALAVSEPARIPIDVLAADGPARGLTIAASVDRGFEAVLLAKKGVQGPLDALEAPDGVLEREAWIPLRAAFTGLGQAWLSQTLVYKKLPAVMAWQAPLQAVQEVLARHVKAANKRLRSDQVQRIEISMPGPAYALALRTSGRPATTPWALPWRLTSAVGALVADHALDVRTHDPEIWSSMQERVAEVAAKVEIQHDWNLTLDLARHTVEAWAPLLAGITLPELQEVVRASEARHVLPGPGVGDLLAIIRTRPDRLYEQVRYASGDLSDARIAEWQFRLSGAVRVHTTRGGAWPEIREIPECSPGWSWSETRRNVFAKWAGEDGDIEAAAALFDAAADRPADDWVRALLMRA